MMTTSSGLKIRLGRRRLSVALLVVWSLAACAAGSAGAAERLGEVRLDYAYY